LTAAAVKQDYRRLARAILGGSEMNQNKLKRQQQNSPVSNTDELTAALDRSARAAVACGMAESKIVNLMIERVREISQHSVSQSAQRPMYDSLAGP
jgi:pantothenate kinase type III